MSNNTNTKRNKPMCVLCHVPLYKSEGEDYQWICSNQKSHKYQLYYEVMSYESDFSSIYGEEEESNMELAGLEGVGEPVLLTANDSNELNFDNSSNKNNNIPPYMRPKAGVSIVQYEEHIPDPNYE